MQIYLINGEDNIGKTDFSVNLAETLSEKNKVLLTSFFRDEKRNIEDYFQKDGMVTYDIADYFLGLCSLDRVEISQNKNLSFIIAPFLEDKYNFKVEDVYDLIDDIDTDILIIDNLDLDVKDAIKVDIIASKDIGKDLKSDYYFVNQADINFDAREYKDSLESKSSKYLGTVKKGEYFKKIIENLIDQKTEPIASLGFFEKLKRIFK